MSSRATSETVPINNYELHYLTAGSAGPTVVLLHGGVIDAGHISWGAAIDPLASEFRVIALDLLGYGKSTIPNKQFSTAFHIRTVIDFLDAIGVETTHLAGTSLGGGIGLGLALEAPHRINRLALVNSFGLGQELPHGTISYVLSRLPFLNKLSLSLLRRSPTLLRSSLESLVYDPAVITDEIVTAVNEQLQRPRIGTAYRRWRSTEVTRTGYRTVYLNRLHELESPTLIIHGENDHIFPASWAIRATNHIPNNESRILENCGHWTPREYPAECNSLLTRFFSS